MRLSRFSGIKSRDNIIVYPINKSDLVEFDWSNSLVGSLWCHDAGTLMLDQSRSLQDILTARQKIYDRQSMILKKPWHSNWSIVDFAPESSIGIILQD